MNRHLAASRLVGNEAGAGNGKNLPFHGKNSSGRVKSLPLTRGVLPTLPCPLSMPRDSHPGQRVLQRE